MSSLRQQILFTLLIVCTCSALSAQSEPDQTENEPDSAYVQSQQAAHWSAYIPIAVLVGASIWLGIADQRHESSASHQSSHHSNHNGLGQMRRSSYPHYSPKACCRAQHCH